MTKLRPPPVAVKHAITEASEYTQKIDEKANTAKHEHFLLVGIRLRKL